MKYEKEEAETWRSTPCFPEVYKLKTRDSN